MSAFKLAATLLIAAGIVGMVYGGIAATRKTHDARIGPPERSI
jgi:NO-binding membrane sensor protein with MHYT domain